MTDYIMHDDDKDPKIIAAEALLAMNTGGGFVNAKGETINNKFIPPRNRYQEDIDKIDYEIQVLQAKIDCLRLRRNSITLYPIIKT